MLSFVRNLFRRTEVRSLDAAAGGRRWENARTVDNLNASIFAGSRVTARRAGYYARNNPWVSSGIASLAANAVGAGIKPQSQHPDPAVRAALQTRWERWTDEADPTGRTDFYGQQALAVRAMMETGEAFGRFRVQPGAGLTVPLRVELMDAEQVPMDLHRELPGAARIRGGVEFDANGVRVAYHVFRARPGDGGPLSLETVRLDAADVVHLFQALAPGQVRGLSWLAPILLRLHELDGYEDAAIVRAKVQALFAAFITDPDGQGGGMADGVTAANGIAETGMEPGTAYVLPPGRNVAFSNPPTGGADYGDFVKVQLRAIAAGLGVTYEQLTGDLEGVTYSSIRSGLVEFRRRIEQLQHGTIVYQFCRPTWERFVRLAVLSGAIEAPDFARNPAPYLSCKWVTPAWDWVDPAKDVKAEIEAIGAGLKSRTQAIGERGYDAERVDDEIAADQARETRLGIKLGKAPAAPVQENANAGND